MAGVRGFADPNVQMNPSSNKSIWYQYALSISFSTLTSLLYNVLFT